jgi:hypothetical protein
MKFAAGIILVFFVSFGQSFYLDCEFKIVNRAYDENFYECLSNTVVTGNSTTIEEVRGTHLSGKGNEDVERFWENGKTLTSFPTNLASFFPNLKVIFIYASLLQLSSSDLQPFPDLLRFHSWYGKFTSLDGDLFQYTRKLKFINFWAPALKNVGANLLTGLNDLVRVYFYASGCIGTLNANTPQLIQELKQKLLLQCPPLETSTSPLTTPRTTLPPTTTLSTSTSTQCSVRCSLDSEVDKLGTKLVTEIANLEERLVELEMMIREIAARP